MALCSTCLSVPWTSLPPVPEYESTCRVADHYEMLEIHFLQSEETTSDHPKPEVPFGFPFHPDIEVLALSAKLCPLCKVIQHSVQAWIDQWTEASKTKKGFVEFQMEHNPIPVEQQLWITKGCEGAQGFYVWARNSQRKNAVYLLAAVGFSVDKGMFTMFGGPIQGSWSIL